MAAEIDYSPGNVLVAAIRAWSRSSHNKVVFLLYAALAVERMAYPPDLELLLSRELD